MFILISIICLSKKAQTALREHYFFLKNQRFVYSRGSYERAS